MNDEPRKVDPFGELEEMKDGVLEVRLPKTEKPKQKTVEVKIG